MKQSCKNFEIITQNQPILKDTPPHDDQKLIEAKSNISGCSEQESNQNREASLKRGYWSQNRNPGSFWVAGSKNLSWFTKVNQINLSGGTKVHNKENLEANSGLENEESKLAIWEGSN